MRIFYFGIYDNNGGLENFAKNLIGEIVKLSPNTHFTLLVLSDSFSYKDFFVSLGCDYIVLPNPHKHPFIFFKKLKKILSDANEDSVIQLNICSFRNPLLFLACKLAKIKTIVVGHYTKVDDGKLPFMHYLNRYLFSKPFVYVSNSDEVTKFMFYKNTKISFINNGIDTSRFSFDSTSRIEIRKKHNIPNDVILIGQVGRISPEKNQIFSVKVFDSVHRHFPNTIMCFIGKEMSDDLRKTIDANDNKQSFLMLGPIYSGLEKYYSAFDIILLPSKNEGMSLSMLESCCNGASSIFSKEVPQLSIKLDNVTYLPLVEEKWVKHIDDIISEKKYKITRKCPLIGTPYELKQCALSYLNLYNNYEQYKKQ